MLISYLKRKHKEREDKWRKRYEEIQKEEILDCYNSNYQWILEVFYKELLKLAESGGEFTYFDFPRPMEFADNDIGSTFEKAARDIGFICDLAPKSFQSHCIICERFSVPLPENGKEMTIAQMMIWGSKYK